MSAKALAYATGCQLVAVATFAAIAEQAPAEARHVWVIADALQGQCTSSGSRGAGERAWAAADELRIDRGGGVVELGRAGRVDERPGGEGVRRPQSRRRIPLVPEADREPRVESVFAVGLGLAPLTREELFALEPLYLRGSSAEEKAKASEAAADEPLRL